MEREKSYMRHVLEQRSALVSTVKNYIIVQHDEAATRILFRSHTGRFNLFTYNYKGHVVPQEHSLFDLMETMVA